MFSPQLCGENYFSLKENKWKNYFGSFLWDFHPMSGNIEIIFMHKGLLFNAKVLLKQLLAHNSSFFDMD